MTSDMVPLEEIKDADRKAHDLWLRLNEELPTAIRQFVDNHLDSIDDVRRALDCRVRLSRFKQAVGLADGPRVCLVFIDAEQQHNFCDDFVYLMNQHGHSHFDLVATGSSVHGLSTNPVAFEKLGYMKAFGDGGETDLDLQVYCPSLLQMAKRESVSLFQNMYWKVPENSTHAQLSTFLNYSDGDNRGLDVIAPWIKQWELKWNVLLSASFVGSGVVFKGIHTALMNSESWHPSDQLGESLLLYRKSAEAEPSAAPDPARM